MLLTFWFLLFSDSIGFGVSINAWCHRCGTVLCHLSPTSPSIDPSHGLPHHRRHLVYILGCCRARTYLPDPRDILHVYNRLFNILSPNFVLRGPEILSDFFNDRFIRSPDVSYVLRVQYHLCQIVERFFLRKRQLPSELW